MKSEERRYVKGRIEAIRDQKIEKIRDDAKANDRLACERLFKEEVKAGRFTIDREALKSADYYDRVAEFLKFRRYPEGIAEHLKAKTIETTARCEAVRLEALRIIDNLMLGDASEALKAIREFEARVF